MADNDKVVPEAAALAAMPIHALARLILIDWPKPYFGAVPYIQAMRLLSADTDMYGCDDAQSICTYFLANAGTWRGPVAKAVKLDIKRRFKLK